MNRAQSQPHLKRELGLRTATALIVGEVIAVGIFLTPAGMAKSLGSFLGVGLVALGFPVYYLLFRRTARDE